ncbi:N-acetylglucosamine 6-phosphate deacetylase [Mesocricetibacter intestinalis]|uniref:N-acetylglucosamine 6-phosphate deacetylase n=1 Tax=Mesocricetibacter intestinalis TaxID=1521930 RepID=A0A4R6V6K3_9PAST|nr:N-acetylglucosamine-6-phosphate deacetylase [Mesocricetibacter intestinalis]TDQ56411.1 N-acetylglucosamine 6-phosphate deacetylase [Mesocricetibacter intestinalis]
MRYAFTNGVIYTAEQVLYGYAVVINGKRIEAVVPEGELAPDMKRLDLEGHNLTAGFIDLQLNGCGGVMFNDDTSVRTLEIMQRTNRKSGTTSFLPTFITATDEEMKTAVAVMGEYLKTHRNQALGLHLEGPYLSVAKKGVHRAEYIRTISPEMKAFLLDNARLIRKITMAAENPSMDCCEDFVRHGIIVSVGHSNADYATAKGAFAKGASFATHLHNAMSPISSGRAMGVVGAVLDTENIYTGIIADGLHVDFANIRIAKRLKGDKLCLVTDATAAAGADIDSFSFVGKTVYVREGKCLDADGTLGGSALTMIEAVKNAVQQVRIPLEEALRMSNYYPAKAIGEEQRLGSIGAGKIANITVFSNKFEIIGTAVNGEWQRAGD